MTFNIGVVAVAFFYFLSGMLMSHSYEKFRRYDRFPALTFWADRAVRIWPSFAAAVLMTVLAVKLVGPHIVSWPVPIITGSNITKNLFVVTLNGLVIGHIPNIVWSAWSLGTEFQFYIFTPLLLILPFPGIFLVVVASILFQIHSYYLTDISMAEYWSFRTSYGTLYIYCMGICFARRANPRYGALLGLIVASQLFLLLLVYPLFRPFFVPTMIEVTIGTLIVVPIVSFAVNFKNKLWDVWDHRIGSLSYPIFLCHLLGMYLADYMVPEGAVSQMWVVYCIVFCLILSVAMYWLVEVPAEKLRYWIRGFRSMQPANLVEPLRAQSETQEAISIERATG
jgi:peptidoglycan/LPS O-acetylase OafA/YrhL